MSDEQNFSGFIDAGEEHDPVDVEVATTNNSETMYIKTPAKKSKDKLPPQAWQDTTMVSIVGDARDGKYLVITNDGEWYLVPVSALHWTVKPQAINNVALQDAEKPYNWGNEIQALSATPDDIRKALWREGLIYKDDAESGDLKKLLKALFTQGVFPVMKE